MSALMIVDLSVHDTVRYKEYLRLAPALIEKHHGKYLARGGNVEDVEGTWHPQRRVVLEFRCVADAHSFLNDPEYQQVAAIRHASASTNLVITDGCWVLPLCDPARERMAECRLPLIAVHSAAACFGVYAREPRQPCARINSRTCG